MGPFTPPRNALNEGLHGGSDDDDDHPNQPLDQNKSVYPEPRGNAAQARLRRFQFRTKDKLAHAVDSKLQMSDSDTEEDEYVTKKMKLGDGSSIRAAAPAPPPCPPTHPPRSPPPPPSPPSPPPSPPPPPPEDSSEEGEVKEK